MHILFTRFPLESALGGAEIQTLSLMDGLMGRGHSVAFAGSCPILLAECRKRNIPTTELQIREPPVTKWGAVSFLWRKSDMKKKLMSVIHEKPDVLVMISLSEKLLLTDIAADAGINVVWVEHDRVGRWLSKNPWLPLLRKQSRKATTVTVSELSKHIYIDELGFPATHVTAIHNGINLKRLAAGETRAKPANSGLHIGCVARLSSDKGVDVLLEAIKDMDDVTLDIAGQGRDAEQIEHLAAALNGDYTRVRIFSSIPEGVGALYRSLDLFVLPSRDHDPCPLAPAEAMALGIATIVTDVCGTAGYVHSRKDAMVVKAGDVESLKQAILYLKDSTVRTEMAAAGKRTAETLFAFDGMIDRYETLFAKGTLSS